MKKLFIFCLPIALLYACGGNTASTQKTELVFDKGQQGLHITALKDTFNAHNESYFVSATVKNSTKDTAKAFLVTAKYFDKDGDAIAESSTGAGKTIAPGDSAKFDNTYNFAADRRPVKVEVSVKSTGF